MSTGIFWDIVHPYKLFAFQYIVIVFHKFVICFCISMNCVTCFTCDSISINYVACSFYVTRFFNIYSAAILVINFNPIFLSLDMLAKLILALKKRAGSSSYVLIYLFQKFSNMLFEKKVFKILSNLCSHIYSLHQSYLPLLISFVS